MLRPAKTDWAHRGNSGVASSFDRPLSRTSLPLSFLRQENRIWWCLDKLQVPLGIPLSGIDWSCYFTSEVPPPDPDYDFIALYSFHPCSPLSLLTQESSIGRPNKYQFNAPNAQQFTKEISAVRLAAKDSLQLAQLRFENSYNKNHIYTPYEPGDKVLVNIHSLQLPESKGPGAKFTWRYDGPFKVTECVSPVAYWIWLPHSYGIHPVLSIAHLKPFKSDSIQERKDLQPLRENPEEYKVEEIIEQWRERHCKRYRLMYWCCWKNFSVTDEWIPESYLRNAKEVLDAWKLKQKEQKLQK